MVVHYQTLSLAPTALTRDDFRRLIPFLAERMARTGATARATVEFASYLLARLVQTEMPPPMSGGWEAWFEFSREFPRSPPGDYRELLEDEERRG